MTYVVRQLVCSSSAVVSGAKTVLANPATRVSVVRARTLPAPYQCVSAAKAGA